jgi:ssDNA-specific exonuclease RecJ
MGRKRVIGTHILSYLEEKGTDVTFKELYGALKQFSKQGIRNSMYTLIKEDLVEKSLMEKTKFSQSRVRFSLKKHSSRAAEHAKDILV